MRHCDWCGQLLDGARRGKGNAQFCTPRCKFAWHNHRERETGWLLLTLVRQLWQYKPADWAFKPGEMPDTAAWRKDWNAAGIWLREQIVAEENDDDA